MEAASSAVILPLCLACQIAFWVQPHAAASFVSLPSNKDAALSISSRTFAFEARRAMRPDNTLIGVLVNASVYFWC
jgi:hypothetical protein